MRAKTRMSPHSDGALAAPAEADPAEGPFLAEFKVTRLDGDASTDNMLDAMEWMVRDRAALARYGHNPYLITVHTRSVTVHPDGAHHFGPWVPLDPGVADV